MSHQPERKDKNCLNCGAIVHGRFCHKCGQENIVVKQGFWSMTKHFVYDILHFDGKFFHTLLYIFTKPGYVAKQYVSGKRLTYLDPIRMYLFTSAIFFLVFFSTKIVTVQNNKLSGNLTLNQRTELAKDWQKRLDKNPNDTALRYQLISLKDTIHRFDIDSFNTSLGNRRIFSFGDKEYRSLSDYDSTQSSLSTDEKDGWIVNRLIPQSIKLGEKYGKTDEGIVTWFNTFLLKLPYMLFLSLPFFALILKLLYIRRKQFYYGDHAVFTFYHYIFSFILLLFVFAFNALQNWTGWGIFNLVMGLLFFVWPIYLYIEMKTFYGQKWFKTLCMFFLLNVSGFIVVVLLFILFLLFSIFQV